MSEETAVTRARINTMQYREINSFDDALALAKETYGNIELASAAIGDGFELLATEQKVQLIGVELMFISWGFSQGDQGEFVSARAVTRDGRKVVLNDGSTGIYEQLKSYTDSTGKDGALYVKRGLRVSEYTYTDDKGETKPAKTYYLDTAA